MNLTNSSQFNFSLAELPGSNHQYSYNAIELIKAQMPGNFINGLISLVFINLVYAALNMGIAYKLDKMLEDLGFKPGFYYSLAFGIHAALTGFAYIYLMALK